MGKVIKVENLSKAYQLGSFGTGTISRDLERLVARLRGKEDPFLKIGETNDRTQKGSSDVVWSLKDINFEVEQGEAVGIIGRNGAGKSTLLKILSRVTSPTTGTAKLKGRVASLLEVGTGFHPELTGRENIYLNGAILGMRKAEIRRKFDEMVDFAGIERYVDTPVKRYSSGMYVRLAFAVAAHLEAEILIVDEVLAVGDAEFQKKCLGKMGEVSRGEGRTVLFVSHSMGAIKSLCKSGILLNKGIIYDFGRDINSIVRKYLTLNVDNDSPLGTWVNKDRQLHDVYFTPLEFNIKMQSGEIVTNSISRDETVVVEIVCEILEPDPSLTFGYSIYDESGEMLYWTYHTDVSKVLWPEIGPGVNIVSSELPIHLLNEGKYRLEMIASLHFRRWILEPGAKNVQLWIEVSGNLSDSPLWMNRRPGILAPVLQWKKVGNYDCRQA